MEKTTASFKQDFNVLTGSGIGVILIQTREPARTQTILREIAFEKAQPFRVWDIVYGWRTYPDNPKAKIEVEKQPDVYKALLRIDDVEGDGKNKWEDGFTVMHYPHWVLPKHPGFIQCLKHYVRSFAESKQRLLLLVPEGFSPPLELQNDLTILHFPFPSREELRAVFQYVMESSMKAGEVFDYYPEDKITILVNNATGMTKLEAENAFSRAVVANKPTWPATPFEDFNRVLLECKTDVVRRSEVLELMDGAKMAEIGGLDLFKEYIGVRTKAFSPEAAEFGVDCPKGIMLVGPPGTGKSLCAKAAATALDLPLIKFDVGRVFGSLIGQSEERVRSALSQLEAMSPCVALIDEVDKGLGGAHTSGGDSGVTRRVLGAILTHMQESKARVYWVFTANRVDSLPPELIRKGRLDEVFCVTVPNNVERLEVLRIHLRKRKQNPDAIPDLRRAVEGSKGYVSAELEAAVKEAITAAFNSGEALTGESILAQLNLMRPISVAFEDDFNKMMEWARNNARMTSTEQEDAASLSSRMEPPPGPRRRSISR